MELESVAELIKSMNLDKDFIQSRVDKEEKEKEKAKEDFEKPLLVVYKDNEFEVFVKGRITGKIKSQLRKLVKKFPKTIKEEAQLRVQNVDLDNEKEVEAFYKKLEKETFYTKDEIKEYVVFDKEPVSEAYTKAVDEFYLNYLKLIISYDGLGSEEIEILKKKELYNEIFDILEVEKKVKFFRSVSNI